MSEFAINRAATGDITKAGCYLKNDFIEERPDGFFDNYPWIHVLKVPGKKVGEDMPDICISEIDKDTILRRRKYALDNREADKLFSKSTRATVTKEVFKTMTTDSEKILNAGAILAALAKVVI